MKGVTIAFLHSSGNSDILIVSFIKNVMGFKTAGWASLRTLAEIPSCPVAFFELSLLICLLIKFSSISLNSRTECVELFSWIFKILGC